MGYREQNLISFFFNFAVREHQNKIVYKFYEEWEP